MSLLPGPLRLTPSFPFVGRPRELATLRSLQPRARAEGRRVALIGGEPGSGKSRLVREFVREAAKDDSTVLYGACDAVVRTSYQPFVEALSALVRDTDPDQLREDMGSGGGELTRLLPDLASVAGPLPAPLSGDQDTERHRLHLAVAELLRNTSMRRPVLLVIEDGHWADTASLLLLRHLARDAADARMLVVATFRDTEADVPAELSDTLADLRRSEGVVRLRLGGLEPAEVAEFLARSVGGEVDGELLALAGNLTDLTSGNPFLITELWRMLLETGAVETGDGGIRMTQPLASIGTPESVREVVGQRVARLAPETVGVLQTAAVVGPEFSYDILRRAEAPDDAVRTTALHEAVRSGMIEELAGRSLSFRFSHELVRRTLYDQLGAVRRAELHLRVGRALEEAGQPMTPRLLADLAHHFTCAAPIGETARAVDYNLRAARAADTALAFDEAAERFATALDLGIDDPAERAVASTELGKACFRAGRSAAALDAFRTAAGVGRELTDGELVAAAAIGFESCCWRLGVSDEGALELLEEARALLPDGDSEQLVMVLGGLARAHAFIGEHERSALYREEAVAMARRLDDRLGLASVLMGSYWTRGSAGTEEVIEMLVEARDVAADLGESELQAESAEWRISALITMSQLALARQELVAVHALAEEVGQPFILHVAEHYAATIALAEGRLDLAEQHAERSREWARLLTGRDPSGIYGVQMFSIRREQGRLAELAPAVRLMARDDGAQASWRPGLVALLAELEMFDEVRRELDGFRRRGLDELRVGLWGAALSYLTDGCAAVGDAAMAGTLYAELEPMRGRNLVIGHGVACYGAADRYLGMLAATIGDRRLAAEHFEDALALNREMGARTYLAHSAYQYGRMLAAGDIGARVHADELLAEAGGLAGEIGMPVLAGRVRAISGPMRLVPSLPDDLSPREAEVIRLVARGMSNREIGEELFISQHTVANHIRSVLRKTGAANRTEVASYAHLRGLAEPAPKE